MNLEKFSLDVTDFSKNLDSMFSWLQTEAMDYFDSITYEKENDEDEHKTINCVIEEKIFLKININKTQKVNIICSNNQVLFSPTGSSSVEFTHIYKTPYGIRLFGAATSAANGDFIITKDNESNTAIIATKRNGGACNSYSYNDTKITNFSTPITAAITALVPCPVGSIGLYTPDVCWTPASSYPSSSTTPMNIISLNGKDYLFDGKIALRIK